MPTAGHIGSRLYVGLMTVALVLGLVYSLVIDGTPERLPPVALGSAALLHTMRIAAFFAIVVVLLSVLERGRRGYLPRSFSTSGFDYDEVSDNDDDLQLQLDGLAAALDGVTEALQEQVDEQNEALAQLANKLDTHRRAP